MNEKDISTEQTFSSKKYKTIFDIASVSLWEEDYSEIKKNINDLKSKGITDFRKYFNETPDFVYKAAQMVKILNVNNFTLKLYGARSKDELLKSLDRVFTPESYKTFKELFIAIAEGKTHFESEAVNKTLQGEPIDILISVTIPSEDGEFKNLLVSVFDITRLKKIEDALRESKEKYKITFDLAPVGIAHTSLEGKFLFVNKTLCEIVGYTEDELLGLTFKDITHPDDLKKNLYAMQQMLEGKTSIYFTEKRYIHKNGSIIHSSLSSAIVHDPSGNLKYFIAIIEDITRRKQLEEELEKRRLIESIGTLAGGIAHDFNNLLTALLLNIFLAKRDLHPDDESFKRLSEAENICMQSKELSNMLITFSHGGDPIKNLISISEILKDTKNLLPDGLKNIFCECIIPENLYPLKADKTQIKQVIKSIIMNATEAMPHGGTVRIRAENTDVSEKDNLPLREGRYLKISIEDQGTGIPEENLKKIFTPYFSTKDMYSRKGMGLALAICYSIIKRHNGLIAVDSKVGIGTTLHIYLPTF